MARKKPMNKPGLRRNPMGGWEVTDTEPDFVTEGNERYRGEPYPEPKKPVRRRNSRAMVAPESVTGSTTKEQSMAKKKKEVETEVNEVKDKPLFRPGTKRAIAFDLLNRDRGTTADEGVKALGWARPVVLSQFYECAKISERKLATKEEEGETVYYLEVA